MHLFFPALLRCYVVGGLFNFMDNNAAGNEIWQQVLLLNPILNDPDFCLALDWKLQVENFPTQFHRTLAIKWECLRCQANS